MSAGASFEVGPTCRRSRSAVRGEAQATARDLPGNRPARRLACQPSCVAAGSHFAPQLDHLFFKFDDTFNGHSSKADEFYDGGPERVLSGKGLVEVSEPVAELLATTDSGSSSISFILWNGEKSGAPLVWMPWRKSVGLFQPKETRAAVRYRGATAPGEGWRKAGLERTGF